MTIILMAIENDYVYILHSDVERHVMVCVWHKHRQMLTQTLV